MQNINILDNGKLGTGTNDSEGVQPGRCPTGKQGRPGRHHATATEGCQGSGNGCPTGKQGRPGHHATATEGCQRSGNGGNQESVGSSRETGDIGVGKKSVRDKKGGRRGKVKGKWTDEERKVLWECFVRSGGKRSGGYIKKVKEMWDGRDLSVRGVPSLFRAANKHRSSDNVRLEIRNVRQKLHANGHDVRQSLNSSKEAAKQTKVH